MEAIVPYLTFDGNASEALAFYEKALEGKILFQQTFGEAPMESKPEDKKRIMHASFEAGDLKFMCSDSMPGHPVSYGSNLSLSIHFKTPESIEKTFAALSNGANVTMPLQDTFWGARFGMLTDKFKINWMFNYDYPKK